MPRGRPEKWKKEKKKKKKTKKKKIKTRHKVLKQEVAIKIFSWEAGALPGMLSPLYASSEKVCKHYRHSTNDGIVQSLSAVPRIKY